MRETAKLQQSNENDKPSLRERADALRARMAGPSSDPMHAAIKDNKKMIPAVRRTRRLPNVGIDRPAEQNAANQALCNHFRSVVLRTAPVTQAGAIALAQYVIEFDRLQGYILEERDLKQVLVLIAGVSAS